MKMGVSWGGAQAHSSKMECLAASLAPKWGQDFPCMGSLSPLNSVLEASADAAEH